MPDTQADRELDVVLVDRDEGRAGGGLLTSEVRAGHGVSLRGGVLVGTPVRRRSGVGPSCHGGARGPVPRSRMAG